MSKEGDKMATETLPIEKPVVKPTQETVTLETDAIIIRGMD